MADLVLKNLTKVYAQGQELAVDRLSLRINDGELVALLGPSGCGKSTTLRMIAGLESVTDGEIWIGDRNVVMTHPKDRGIGLAFEDYALYPPMNVYENLAFNLKAKGLPPRERDQRIRKISKLLHLEGLLDVKPRSLSSGQKQRVNIARALVRYPSVLLLDEPLSHLDPRLRSRMRTEIKRLHTEMRFTTVLVTHDQTEAMALADRIAVLKDGRLQQFGDPLEVFAHPINEFVAAFIGEPPMNIFTVFRNIDLDCLEIKDTEFRVELTDSLRARLGKTVRVRLGIRPQDISVTREELPGRLHVQGDIAVVENLGDETHVGIRYGDVLVMIHCFGRLSHVPGDRLICSFDESSVLLFDMETGDQLIVPECV